MRKGRYLVFVCALMLLSLAAGVLANALWRTRASNREAAQLARYDYAVITNLRTTTYGGKVIATAWVRYLQQSGADPVGVNRSVSFATDFPKDDAALRRWVTTTNSEESVNLTGVNVTAGMVRQDLYEQVKREAVARAVAKLGEEGWEMVGPDQGAAAFFAVNPLLGQDATSEGTPLMIYFKRRVP